MLKGLRNETDTVPSPVLVYVMQTQALQWATRLQWGERAWLCSHQHLPDTVALLATQGTPACCLPMKEH